MSRSAGRHAGLLVPLFSIPSTRSWGIGEIADLVPFAAWLREAGQDLVQILPVNEMAEGQHSPYSAMSAMAIDPIYISVYAVPDFEAMGGEQALSTKARRDLTKARRAAAIDYDRVRRVKQAALRQAFDRFVREEWEKEAPRAHALRDFIRRESWWLDDYALFRALHAEHKAQAWTDWEPALRNLEPEALDAARGHHAAAVLYYQYLQWIVDTQWHEARAEMGGVGVYGDLPFMVSSDSADVWARQAEFDLTASVGTPPDDFAEDGQDWGLPVCRWDVMRGNNFAWLRDRARRNAALFDGYRVDHLVGFYRTYVRPASGKPFFEPAEEPEQTAQGEHLMQLFAEPGARIIAEDLGTVPDFVRASLARLGVPGYKVLRWEREWTEKGQPFRDPPLYPAVSVATAGTHDTEPLAVWWDEAAEDERAAVAEIPALASRGIDVATSPFTPELRDVFLDVLFESGSDYLILPIQDVFGWRDRVNVPGTVDPSNWTWRLPWPVDRLGDQAEAVERARALRAMSERHRRDLVATTRREE